MTRTRLQQNVSFPEVWKWFQNHFSIVMVGIVAAYIVSRWLGSTALPVFADEAIYIRWSQLLKQGSEYWFFAMNDGKPPLFVWTLFPWLETFSDPLWAARSWSAVVGLLQLVVIMGTLRSLKQTRGTQLAGALLVILTPFWFLHHRLALMDGLLTLGISLSWWGLIELDKHLTKPVKKWLPLSSWLLLAGLGWGIALLTKTTALFLAPVFVGLALAGLQWDLRKAVRKGEQTTLVQRLLVFGLAGAMGLACFVALRIHPAFGSLFARSSDFSYSLGEWADQMGRPTWDNVRRVLPWLAQYLRPELFTFAAASLVFSRFRRYHLWHWLAGIIAISPLILLGKTLHPRYFLPLVPFITLSAASFLSETWDWVHSSWKKGQKELGIIALTLSLLFVVTSLRFQVLLQFAPHLTPFVLDDREQYLTSWAAGYGIPQVREKLLERARAGERTTVVTEGSFGTLPDGLLLYFDRAPEIQYLRIEGLAQYPVKTLPDWVVELARHEEVWLMVNANRLELSAEQSKYLQPLAKTDKPYGGPALLVFRITPTE